jgi:hypothetical protein
MSGLIGLTTRLPSNFILYSMAAVLPSLLLVRRTAVVASTAAVNVRLIDAGISDHHALRWQSVGSASTPSPLANIVPELIRPWRRLDMAAFQTAVSASRLCRSDTWPNDVDDLCSLYNIELTAILDQLLPMRVPPPRSVHLILGLMLTILRLSVLHVGLNVPML